MDYNTRSRPLQRINRQTGKWISYQLKLDGITHSDVARQAGVAAQMVSQVLNGTKSSVRVYDVLPRVLGYNTLNDLLKDAARAIA